MLALAIAFGIVELVIEIDQIVVEVVVEIILIIVHLIVVEIVLVFEVVLAVRWIRRARFEAVVSAPELARFL
jgi:hypothetical protein